MNSQIGDYRHLLSAFLKKDYRAVSFGDQDSSHGELILRHDIDFDCGLARQMAEIEADLGVTSTYFFMLRSESYNLLSDGNDEHVNAIRKAGHRISLHFDPTVYDDFVAGFQTEKTIFETMFETTIDIVSLHRPNDFFLQYDQPIAGTAHTYQRHFFKDIAYMSDSQGQFRYGHPLESEAFAEGRTIHLLTHPIWWMVPNPGSAIDLLNDFLEKRTHAYRHHMAQNCIPYRDYLACSQ